ncbi:hypothetical protein [Streptomyces axinellae]
MIDAAAGPSARLNLPDSVRTRPPRSARRPARERTTPSIFDGLSSIPSASAISRQIIGSRPARFASAGTATLR